MNTMAVIAFFIGLLIGVIIGYAICKEYSHE